MTRDARLMAFSLFCWGVGEGLFIYIQPLYLRQLGADPATIGRALALVALAAGVAHVPAGLLADHFGRKPLFIAGWGLGLAACVAMFLARDLTQFVPALVGYGFTGFVVSPINAYVAEARGPLSVQRVLTLVSAGFSAGMIFSPALGGVIARVWEVRGVFAVASVAFAISTVAMLLLHPQPRAAPPPGQGRYGELLSNRRFIGFVALMGVSLLVMQLGFPLMANFVETVRGYDVAFVAVLGSANSLGIVVIHTWLGHARPRRGFLLAQALLAGSLALMLLTTSAIWLFAVYFLRAGWMLGRNMASAQVGRVVRPDQLGLALGMVESVGAAAAMLGPLAAGELFARQPASPFWLSLGLLPVTMLLVWRFAPRRDAHT